MVSIKVYKEKYAGVFGGLGFHNNEALLYPIIEKEHFDQILCKCYREIAPGFMRTFGGYDDWSKESMDAFAAYYHRMQRITDTPIYLTAAMGKVIYTDEDLRLYCDRVADNLLYLKKEKDVGHIRYYCFSNELSCGTHHVLKNDLPRLKWYHQGLYSAFVRKMLDVGLLATDGTGYPEWPTAEWALENMHDITEDLSLHIYERQHDIYDLSFYDFFYDKCKEICDLAIRKGGRRLLLTEFGIQDGSGTHLQFGNGVIRDLCRYYEDPEKEAYCALMLAEMIFAAINAGVFAMAYWSYTDYPSPYSCAYSAKDGFAKAWGSCERFVSTTTDTKYNKFGVFKWEDDGDHSARSHYWCLAPLMKLFKRNSYVLNMENSDPMLRMCGVMNRDGSVSLGIVNRSKEEASIQLDTQLFTKGIRVYEYDSKNVPANPFGDIQAASATLEPQNASYILKPESVTFFTTDYIEKAAPVVAENLALQGGILTWSPVADPEHCYYRVYASHTPDFSPNSGNQIASTVATDLPVTNNSLYYKVLSVDNSGNV